jgi:DNA-binding transcriptional regulator GbsR (MarR family)
MWTSDIVHGSMNNMKKQEAQKLQKLALVVGDFIRYWGFRKIHGEIWTVVFLSKKALSGVEIERLLGVSKALVSPAIQELVKEGLIRPAASENSKTKRYEAVENVAEVIRGVLRRREQPMISEAADRHAALAEVTETDGDLNRDRLEKLGSLIQSANFSLLALINEDVFWTS